MPGSRCSILLVQEGTLVHGAAPSLPVRYSRAIDGRPDRPDDRFLRGRRLPQPARGRARRGHRRQLGRATARSPPSTACARAGRARSPRPTAPSSGTFAVYHDIPHEPGAARAGAAGELQRPGGDRHPPRARRRRAQRHARAAVGDEPRAAHADELDRRLRRDAAPRRPPARAPRRARSSTSPTPPGTSSAWSRTCSTSRSWTPGVVRPKLEAVELAPLLREVASILSPLAEEREVTVRSHRRRARPGPTSSGCARRC